jgi:hypothetical protein
LGGVPVNDAPVYSHWRRAYVGEMLRLAEPDPSGSGCLLVPSARKVSIPFWLRTPTRPARIMWEGMYGTPPGRLYRICHNRRCIAPGHLRSD